MSKLAEAVHGDYRKPEVREFIQEKLKKIPALSNIEGIVSLELLERVLIKINKKYKVALQYIMPNIQKDGQFYYSASFKRTDTHEWVGTVNGVSIYEIFAKGVLMAYSYAKQHDTNLH